MNETSTQSGSNSESKDKSRARTAKTYVIKPGGSKNRGNTQSRSRVVGKGKTSGASKTKGGGRGGASRKNVRNRNSASGTSGGSKMSKTEKKLGVDNYQLDLEIQEMEQMMAGDTEQDSQRADDKAEDVKTSKKSDDAEKQESPTESAPPEEASDNSKQENANSRDSRNSEPLPDITYYKGLSIPELFDMATSMNIPGIKSLKYDEVIFKIMKQKAEEVASNNMVFVKGVLETMADGYGFLRTRGYSISDGDVYVSPSQIRRFGLRTGDLVIGHARLARDSEKYAALLRVDAVNYELPVQGVKRIDFDDLVPVFPDNKIKLEYGNDISTRVVDLITPIGFGQRGLIVAPPKAGKTMLLKKIANAICRNHPEVQLIMLLIDERPEEVTDIARSIEGEVVASTFDEPITQHIRVSEMVLERARRLVETGRDVVIMMDSITRLARAYNLHLPSTGQTLSGGVNPAALYKPKRFFGSARNIENGGSITILSTALVDTGSKMDEIIFEEFKGTGNMELLLDRKIFDKRIFPSIDITRSSTRKEELLLDESDLQKIWVLRKYFSSMSPSDAIELLLSRMRETKDNEDFLSLLSEDSIY